MQKRGMTRRAIALIVLAFIVFGFYLLFSKEQEPEFYLSPTNKQPIISEIDKKIFVCEGEALSYLIDAGDPENDFLEFNIAPKNPLYIRKISTYQNITRAEIYSGNLTKNQTGDFNQTIYVSDGQLIESAETEISVIEINNPPVIRDIGSFTVDEDNQEFSWQVLADDQEDGNQDSNNLTFSLNFLNGDDLFDISTKGAVEFVYDEEKIGTHDIRVCAADKNLKKPHEHILQCGQDGSSESACKDFQLTITEKNRQPTVLEQFPYSRNLNATGSEYLFFNISKFDPDGTTPETKWYLNDELKETDMGQGSDTLIFTFGCGIKGGFNVVAVISDGLNSDSVGWNITLSKSECPEGFLEGTDSARTLNCKEKWACLEWDLCQEISASAQYGLLTQTEFQSIKGECEKNSWTSCGFQTRNCFDLNYCNTSVHKLPETQACLFSLDPSCFDNLINCHDGNCELMTDCGDPCSPCPTCSDGIQNQGENDVDCSGPCLKICEAEKPLIQKESIKYTLYFVFAIAGLIVLFLIFRVLNLEKELIPTKKKEVEHEENK
ncbi:hypothetical protein J4462_04275 [Candidatus Pacearchaeota archaeon]|nr:hypothetical protein [Candidatus Pacearchaeota archaeon]